MTAPRNPSYHKRQLGFGKKERMRMNLLVPVELLEAFRLLMHAMGGRFAQIRLEGWGHLNRCRRLRLNRAAPQIESANKGK